MSFEGNFNTPHTPRAENPEPAKTQLGKTRALQLAIVAALTSGAAPLENAHAHTPELETHMAKDALKENQAMSERIFKSQFGDKNALQGHKYRNIRMLLDVQRGEIAEELEFDLNKIQPAVMRFDEQQGKFYDLMNRVKDIKPDPKVIAAPDFGVQLAKASVALRGLSGLGEFVGSCYVQQLQNVKVGKKILQQSVRYIEPRIIASDPHMRSRLNHLNEMLAEFLSYNESIQKKAFEDVDEEFKKGLEEFQRFMRLQADAGRIEDV